MKKLHGTYSIQPLTITNSSIAEDAAIDESKINLSFSTVSLNGTLNTVTQDLSTHVNNNTDPHGQTLVQSVLQTEIIHSDNADNTRTITISNPGEGDVILQVEGDISAVNASFSGDTSIAGITTIGGQTHITGNVVIDGNLSVSGETTTVESNTIDYDSLLVTPSTALNRTGIIVAPDGTGFVDNEESETTTVQVHDDLLFTNNGGISDVEELPNGDLVFSMYTRLVKTNAGISEIKAVYEAGENEELEYITIGTNGDLFVITDNTDTNTVYVTKLDTNLNLISKSSAIVNSSTNANVEVWDVYSFDYIDSKFYISLYENNLIGYFDEYDIDGSTNEETFTTFETLTASITLDTIIQSESEIELYYAKPFQPSGSNDIYILVSCTEGVYLLDDHFNLVSDNIISTGSDFDELFYEGTYLDTRNNRIVVSDGECVYFSFDVEPFLEDSADMMTANLTTTTMSSDFNTTDAPTFLIGFTGDNDILYYNSTDNMFKWVDSSKFISYDSMDPVTGELAYATDTTMIVRTRTSADSTLNTSNFSPAPIQNAVLYDLFTDENNVTYIKSNVGTLYRVDLNTNTFMTPVNTQGIHNVSGTGTVYGSALTPDGTVLYECVGQDFAGAINIETGNTLFNRMSFSAGYVPNGFTIRDNNGSIEEIYWAFNYNTNYPEIRIYDGETRELLKAIEIGFGYGGITAMDMILSSDNNWLYLADLSTQYYIIRAFDLRATSGIADTSSEYYRELKLSYTYDGVNADYISSMSLTSDRRIIAGTKNAEILEFDENTGSLLSRLSMANSAPESVSMSYLTVSGDTVIVSCINRPGFNTSYVYTVDISTPGNIENSEVVDFIDSLSEGEDGLGDWEEPEEPGDIIRTTAVETQSEPVGDTFLGNLLELQKRTRGFNEAAVIVDKSGTLKLLTGGLEVGNVKGSVNNNVLLFDKGLGASLLKATNDGFVYRPSSDNQPNNKAFDIQDASGVSNAFITKNGDATVNSLTIGVSSAITEAGTGLVIPNDVNISSSELLLDNSTLTFGAENKNEWRVLNRNSTISFYYDTESTPQVELGDNLFDLSNCETTKTDDLVVMGDATFNGSVNMAANMTVDGIKVGSHDHTGGDMGTVLPQTAVTGLKTFVDNINTTIKNCVNEMTTSNTESGMNVAYNSSTGKLNFSVNDFTITLSGNASGSATIQHASNATLSVTVLDSAKLGGLSLASSTANADANRVLRTDANGKTSVKALLMSSPTAAGTGTLGKIYASVGNETEVKVYTPANFATQLLALGGTTKNSHTHTDVNGLTPIRGSSTFNGVSGRVIMLSSSRANTNYSVAVTPSAAPNGLLGEIWVIKGTDRFTVYNSGSATSAFDYIMLG